MIHQIFFDFGKGKKITDYKLYLQSVECWKALAIKEGITYRLHNDSTANSLIELYPKYKNFFYQLTPIQKLDFYKILLLYHYGGIYVDLDILPNCPDLSWVSYPMIRVDSGRKIRGVHYTHDFIALEPKDTRIGLNCLDYMVKEYQYKKARYSKLRWVGRFVLQTTGSYGFSRYLKLHDIPFKPLFATTFDKKGKELYRKIDSKIIVYHTNSW